MAIFRSSLVVAAIFAAMVQPAVAGSMPPLSDRVSRLPDTAFQAWFGVMLESEFGRGPDWQAFFGDVGPTEGCAAHKEIKIRIVQRDLIQFKAAYVDAVSKGMNPTVLSNVPDNRLSNAFDSRLIRFQYELKDFLRPRVAELGTAGREWANSHGYLGRRLGYNSAGVPYYWQQHFGPQHAMTALVCMFPRDSGLLRGWK